MTSKYMCLSYAYKNHIYNCKFLHTPFSVEYSWPFKNHGRGAVDIPKTIDLNFPNRILALQPRLSDRGHRVEDLGRRGLLGLEVG